MTAQDQQYVGLINEPVYIVQDDLLKWTNDALAHLLGHPKEELRDKNLRTIAPTDHQHIVQKFVTDPAVSLKGDETIRSQILHRCGASIDVLVQPKAVLWDSAAAVEVTIKKVCLGSLSRLREKGEVSSQQRVDMVSAKLAKAQKETARLIVHKEMLLGAMREMVFLIGKDHVIEYMNPSAERVFGAQRGQVCHIALFKRKKPCETPCPLKIMGDLNSTELKETKIGKLDVEFSAVPFKGYRGDELALVVMRDITERKRLQKEVEAFNNNLEEVIRNKINELEESEKIRKQLASEINTLRSQLNLEQQNDGMIGNNKAILELREMVCAVASSNATVLITGESGTGKELVASLIHKHSNRRDKVFLKFNCAAITESLLESDLFGYEKGAFTGAMATRKGKFEFADGGTIFLDEIGDISAKTQIALLRVLQNNEIQRVGSSETIKVDARVITSTNADLPQKVMNGEFRRDLYYRLNIINIHLPPLRDRKDDILALATHFIRKYRKNFNKEVDFLPPDAINRLLAYDWPGNIRELENVIQRSLILARGNILTAQDLVFSPPPPSPYGALSNSEELAAELLNKPLKTSIAELEKKIIAAALKKTEGKVQEAASMVGLGKTVFYDRMKRYGL